MRSTTSELNWSGTVTYTAERVVRPTSLDDVAELVARSPRIHGLGTRHSFNDVADTAGVLLDLTAVPTDLVVAEDRRTATMGAGTRYGLVAPALDAAGVALHNEGSLPPHLARRCDRHRYARLRNHPRLAEHRGGRARADRPGRHHDDDPAR
ncbi:FAD-binding protein [Curtobacterium sp. MCPF17_052]|uniref:FAD-binding protein n=1 Tax=Curtobacterium sp. MCPF17_052 TaxID=2175655 RepID=UPI0024E03078|nr:FAD-binding protein [Curtobacterium sp. MCPF17_052]WIB13158.1 FAD-binding protein [Curtobacterium sp. MCPF17_052]